MIGGDGKQDARFGDGVFTALAAPLIETRGLMIKQNKLGLLRFITL